MKMEDQLVLCLQAVKVYLQNALYCTVHLDFTWNESVSVKVWVFTWEWKGMGAGDV